MTQKNANRNSRAIGEAMGARIKDLMQNGKDPQEIQNVIWEVLKENGVELPEKVKRAIEEYQQPKPS